MTKKTGKKLQLKTIVKAVTASNAKNQLNLEPNQLESIARDLKAVNDIIHAHGYNTHNKLYAVCEKAPRNLDSGNHYFSIHYVKDNCTKQVWLWDFIKLVGGKAQNRDPHMCKYVFFSGAIGMSRVLDATDGLFAYLRSIGGCYTQINSIN